jgi:TetR/AcrR family transcriptional regulator, repressor of fatR-cypB operon
MFIRGVTPVARSGRPARSGRRARGTEPVSSRRDSILDAALDLFVERGFEATSVPEVARRARIAAGTIYLYFASKEALVNAVLARIKTTLAERLTAAIDPAAPLERQFRAICATFGSWAIEEPRACGFSDLHHHAPYVTQETLAAFDPARKAIDAHLRAGRDAGIYRDLPVPALRAFLVGPLVGLVKFERLGELRLTPALVEEAADVAWAGIARKSTARRRKESSS